MTTYEKTTLLDEIDDWENGLDEEMDETEMAKYIFRAFEAFRYEIERMN